MVVEIIQPGTGQNARGVIVISVCEFRIVVRLNAFPVIPFKKVFEDIGITQVVRIPQKIIVGSECLTVTQTNPVTI